MCVRVCVCVCVVHCRYVCGQLNRYRWPPTCVCVWVAVFLRVYVMSTQIDVRERIVVGRSRRRRRRCRGGWWS